MHTKLKNIFSFLLIVLLSNASISQELFHEIEIGKKFAAKKALFVVDLNWKKEYKNESWNRIGLNFTAIKSLKNNWTVAAGIENYYVIDPNSVNSYEIRPSIMINLKSKILDNLYLSQFLKTEWRNMFYIETYNYDNYHRMRYRFHFDWLAYNKDKQVSIKPGIEWYLLKNTSNGERYANSKEYYLRFTIEKNEQEWSFGYKRETFLKTIAPNEDKVNTFFFEYKF